MDPKPKGGGLSFKRLLFDYSKWCTLVCLNRIVTTKAKWLAVVFGIIFIVMVVVFIYITVNLIIKYFKYPSSTDLSIDVTPQDFPRFSFCNENPLKRSIVDMDPAFAQISKLMRQFEQLEQKTIGIDDFEVGKSAMKMQRISRARAMLRLLMHKLSDADRIRAGYNFTELVSECTFAGRTCSSNDFKMFLHPDYGVCFTFTKDRVVTKAGSDQALRILMTVNQDSPRFNVFDFLPTSDSSNMRGLLHLPNDFPDMTNDAFKLAAKTQASVAFTKMNRTRSPKPYDNCTSQHEMGENDYYSNYTYTFNSCQRSCLQRLAWKFCRCVDPLYLKAPFHTYCSTPADMLCIVNLPSHVTEANADNGHYICDCHPPCEEQVFGQTITYGVFPPRKYAVATGTQKQRELLRLKNGVRTGNGHDYDDDYEGTTTVAPTTTPTTTTTLRPHTTAPPICPPELLSVEESICSIGEFAHECREASAFYFNNPKYTVIVGWPCTSQKKCRTCVMYAEPPAVWDWPCQYDGYEQCTNYNNRGTTSFQCSQFFNMFDFIPTGVDIPNIPGWITGKLPSDSACNSINATTQPTQRANCWTTSDCKRIPSSSNLLQSANSLLDPAFLKWANVTNTMTPCQLQRLALDAARLRPNQTKIAQGGSVRSPFPSAPDPGSSCSGRKTEPLPVGRKKRSALVELADEDDADSGRTFPKRERRSASANGPSALTTTTTMTTLAGKQPTDNVTVDMPGYGSCEFANRNFKGAGECIHWYQRNGLLFELYYESLTLQSYTQAPTYNLVTMLADIGGHAGLWLGISIVSLVEFVALFFMCCNKIIRGKNMATSEEPALDQAKVNERTPEKELKSNSFDQ